MTENGVAKQFQPQFTVKVISAAKNGEVVEFFVESTKNGEERANVVIRVHEDFVWLLHCLQTMENVASVIFPPLPERPITSLQAAEKKTKKQVGSKTSVLVGDDYENNCRSYEKFLNLLTNHPRLGNSAVLQKFVREKEAPARVKVRRGIFGVLTKVVDDIKVSNYKDSDESFQQTRVSNTENIKNMKQAAHAFQKIVDTQYRITNAYAEIYSVLQQMSTDCAAPVFSTTLLTPLNEAVQHAIELHNVNATNSQRTLGSTLHLYAGYSQSQHDMLQKRVHKAIELDNSKKIYEKAKPPKKVQAEEAMKKLATELEVMTSLAKPELERYNRQRVLAMQTGLTLLADSEIKNSRDAVAVFTKSCSRVQQI
uniref:Sorting nexin-5 n=1 Tax=Ciona intestinalis TaxID=7719 RepID=F7AP23_CIOIN|nr:sorting nexin-5 [Ciona intestinalis]|eukprot:XP_002121301.1 sorting nexin-5 [Ciona intestinalis]